MKKFPKELKFFFAVFFAMTLFFSASSPVLALENSFDYVNGVNYEPIAKLVNFLNDKKSELEKIGDNFGKTVVVKTRAPDASNQNRAKKSFLLSAVLEPVKDAVIGKPKQYAEKVFCVAKDFIFPGACKDGVNQYYSGATTQEKNNKEEMDALKKQYDDAIASANELNQKFNLLQKEIGKVKAGGVIIKEPIIEQKTVERTIEKIVSGLSQDDLSASIALIKTELNNLNTNLTNQINNLSFNTSRQSTAAFNAISLTNRIDSLSGTRLSGITVNGVSGLTDADIPDGITASNYLSLTGGIISGDLTIIGNATLGVITLQNATAGYFTATSTAQASTFPYASSTALTVAGSSWFNGLSTMANLLLSGSTTLQNFTANNSTTTNATTTNLAVSGNATIGNLNGPLQANNGLVSATTSVGYQYGGTGLTSSPSFGQILRGTGTGYALVATSTLGINTGDLIEGANLFWTNDRFDNRLSATTTLPNITTLASLATVGTITSGNWNGSSIVDAYINNDITLTNLTQITNRAISDTTGTLAVARGGTGQTSFGQGWLSSDGTTISASTSPTVNYFVATSTTATSTFAGGLSVAGHCVTGDTRLRRRRKKKNGEGYEYDEVAIKDVQIGDEIASLDEETGEIVWSKVNALMDMGVKEIYKLKTADGRQIRTTSTHPYLVKDIGSRSPKHASPVSGAGWLDVNSIKKDDWIAAPKPRAGVFIDNANIFYAQKRSGWKVDFLKFKNLLAKEFDIKVFNYYAATPDNQDPSFRATDKFLKKISQFAALKVKPLKYIEIARGKYEKKGDMDVDLSLDVQDVADDLDVVIVVSGDSDLVSLRDRVLKRAGKKFIFAGFKHNTAWEIKDGKYLEFEKVRGSVELGVENKTTPELAPGRTLLPLLYSADTFMSSLNGDKSDMVWVRVESIEKTGAEQVYDIEVDGTHNFIGNDIVAHNTYIGGTASSTNLVVSNNSALGTVSSGLWNGSSIATQYGGTGQNFSASSGLINLYSGTASAIATSSIGLLTTDVAEGTNQYWTNTRFDNRLSSTTTLPNLTTLLGLTNASTTGLTVTGQTTLATSLTGLLKGASGVVSAITTSLGLAGEISDETGSGALVFGTSPTFTTQITTPSIVSAGALGITPASGSNLNVNLAGTGDFAVNTSQLYVDTSSGNVGVGTTTPTQKLDVVGGAAFSGNVGVGTTGPIDKLQVVGGALFGASMASVGVVETKDYSLYLAAPVDGSNQGIVQLSNIYGGGLQINSLNYVSPAALPSTGTLYKNLVSILATGNVGIGTTAPQARLDLGTGVGSKLMLYDNGAGINAGFFIDSPIGNDATFAAHSNGALVFGKTTFATAPTFGTEWMRITNGGNVGIGTTAPGQKLEVAGNIQATGSTRQIILGNAQGIQDPGNGDLILRTSGGEKIRILDNGNVGIGTTAPAAKLHIDSGTANQDVAFRLRNQTASGYWDITNIGGNANLQFAHGANTFVTFNTSGNVGIGTTAPGQKLQVDVTGNADALRLSNSASALTTNWVGNEYYLKNDGGESISYGGIRVQSTGIVQGANAETGKMIFSTKQSGQDPNPTDWMVLDSSGNVGIGTTNPNAKLEIYDNIPRLSLYDTATSKRWEINKQYGGLNFSEIGVADARLFLKDGGNVGIGTTNPQVKLQLGGQNELLRIGDGLGDVTVGVNTFAGGATILQSQNVNSVNRMSFGAGAISAFSGSVGIGYNGDVVSGGGAKLAVNGNVGIGTTAPTYKLVVEDAASNNHIVSKVGSVLMALSGNGTSGGVVGTLSNDKVNIMTNSGTRMTVDTSGNVGIGTTTPGERLEVANGSLYVHGPIGGHGRIIMQMDGNNQFEWYPQTTGLHLYDRTAAQYRMSVLNSGNVGIGTTVPTSNMEIVNSGGATLGIHSNGSVANNKIIIGKTLTNPIRGELTSNNSGNFDINSVWDFGALTLSTQSVEHMRITATGNVGIGTTSPAQLLSVAGHCVTGDTRLRRRRKKKNGEGYEYDEVAIKNVQTGDEIASLDEEIGKIVWSKVNALMDMGVKEIYKLTTASGKTIRTTAEHPYMVKKKEISSARAVAFIDYANIKAWLRDKKLSIDLELLIKTIRSAGVMDARFYYGSDSEKNSIQNFFKKLQSFGYTVITKPIQYFKVSLSSLLKQKTNKRLLESISDSFEASLEKEAFRMDKENVSLLAPKANFDVEISIDAVKKTKNADVFVLFSGDGDFAYLLKELKSLGKKIVVVSGRKSLSGALIVEADKFVTLERLSERLSGLVWSDKNARPARRQVLKNCSSIIADLLGLSNRAVDNFPTIQNGLWKKVVYLKEGMEIAVSDNGNGKAAWDKIDKIEILPAEQVYDIEVDGTHNFIGNDIVAHNTYLTGGLGAGVVETINGNITGTGRLSVTSTTATSTFSTGGLAIGTNQFVVQQTSGNVGIGTAAPLSILHVKSATPSTAYLTISNNGDSNGNLALNEIAGLINFYSHDPSTTSLGGIGSIAVKAETAYDTANTPSYMTFSTHANTTNDGTLLGNVTEQMRITAAGNVGIGTTTPMSLLSLKGSSGAQMTIAQADTNYTKLTVDASGNFTLTPSGSVITIPDDNLKICSGDACQTTALNSGNGNLTVENNIEIGGNYNRTCATGYVWVPGSSKFGTLPGFCAMKYEAKNDGSNNAVSTATGGPYVSIDQPTSRTKCEAVGLGYHLINEMEWMTIAENIAQTPINDMDDDAGLQLATGHSDNAPASAQAATSASDPVVSGCNLSTTMENGANAYSASSCEIQGDGSYGGDDNDKGFYGTSQAWATTGYSAGTANKSQLRTHILSNGNVIWDIAGNVWEWTDAYVNGTAEKPAPTADAWVEYTAITDYTTLNYARPQNPAWTSANGIGQYYAGASAGQRGFFRGGRWDGGTIAGVFTLYLNLAPSYTSTTIGFRCAR